MSKTTPETKEIFVVYKQNIGKFFDDVEKSLPQYLQSITNLQQEYTEAWKNTFDSAVSLQQEYATKSGLNTNVPSAYIKVINDATEEIIKVRSVQNKIALATIDVARQNLRSFNDSTKAFSELNQNMLQSWISAWTPTRNQ